LPVDLTRVGVTEKLCGEIGAVLGEFAGRKASLEERFTGVASGFQLRMVTSWHTWQQQQQSLRSDDGGR